MKDKVKKIQVDWDKWRRLEREEWLEKNWIAVVLVLYGVAILCLAIAGLTSNF